MGAASDKLMELWPVSFCYKADPTATRQYGLIAEEVAEVYPELVVRDADGKPETVAYQALPAMLLNEVQKQSRWLAQKEVEIATLKREVVPWRKKKIKSMRLPDGSTRSSSRHALPHPDTLAALAR
jgi:hypothetical protein